MQTFHNKVQARGIFKVHEMQIDIQVIPAELHTRYERQQGIEWVNRLVCTVGLHIQKVCLSISLNSKNLNHMLLVGRPLYRY